MRRTLFALTLLLAVSALGADDVIKRGFNVAPGGTLRLDADIGSIKVVTGGAGGVGAAIVSRLRADGHVEVLDVASGDDAASFDVASAAAAAARPARPGRGARTGW